MLVSYTLELSFQIKSQLSNRWCMPNSVLLLRRGWKRRFQWYLTSASLLWLSINLDKPYPKVKGSRLETHIKVVGYCRNRLGEPLQGPHGCANRLSLAVIIDWRVVKGDRIVVKQSSKNLQLMELLSRLFEEDLSDGKMSFLFYCSMRERTCYKLTNRNFLIAIQTYLLKRISCIFSFNYWILFHLRFWKELCLRPANRWKRKLSSIPHSGKYLNLSFIQTKWFPKHKPVLEVDWVFKMLPEWN